MNKHFLKNISLLLLVGVSFSIFPTYAFAEDVEKLPTTLETPKLPEINFQRPENLPDINVDLSSEYETIMKDLEGKGFGKVTLNLKEQGLNTDWSNKGSVGKLSSEEFASYLTNVESKYSAQINAAKESASGLSYEKLDLKGKWDLMSMEEAKSQSAKLPDYNSLKNSLQSSASMPPINKATLSHTPPAEFNAIKNSVMQGNTLPNLGSFGNLPTGLTKNPDGTFTDNRKLESIPFLIGDTLGNTISDLPSIIGGFGEGWNDGFFSFGDKKSESSFDYGSVINRQQYLEDEINKIH